MENVDSIRFTGARFIDWNEEEIIRYVGKESGSQTSKLLGIFFHDAHIGNIRIHSIDRNNETCEVGILIFEKQSRGKGFGSEALMKALDFIQEDLKLTRVTADYFQENLASCRLFQKCGFMIEGVFRNHFKNLDSTFSNSVRVGLNFGTRANQ